MGLLESFYVAMQWAAKLRTFTIAIVKFILVSHFYDAVLVVIIFIVSLLHSLPFFYELLRILMNLDYFYFFFFNSVLPFMHEILNFIVT